MRVVEILPVNIIGRGREPDGPVLREDHVAHGGDGRVGEAVAAVSRVVPVDGLGVAQPVEGHERDADALGLDAGLLLLNLEQKNEQRKKRS